MPSKSSTHWIAACAMALSAASAARSDFTVQRVLAGLNQPVQVAHAPGDPASLYIVERNDGSGQLGRIRKYDMMTGMASTFLDVSGSVIDDGGLMSMTFHPEFQSNGLFYVMTAVGAAPGQGFRGTSALDEYRLIGGTPQLQRRILQYNQPVHLWHTINEAHFRPNGNNNELIVLTGDGGTQANEGSFNAALIEDPSSIFGKILQIDLSASFPTPASDATHPGIDVLALGIRNPFRSSFDRQTGDFYFGDVGFTAREEIDFIPAAHMANSNPTPLNFGWPQREGMIQTPHAPGGPLQPGDINPILDYPHNASAPIGGFAVIGGYVYRGPVSELQGRYFFAEHILGNVFSGLFDTNTPVANYNGANITGVVNHTVDFENRVGQGTNIQLITAFGEDPAGNLYIVKIGSSSCPACQVGTGEVFRVVPTVADAVSATINRGSGEILLTNTSASPIAFTSLAIGSAIEAVKASGLKSISGYYDADGNMQIDGNDTWEIISPPGSLAVFRESTTGDAGALGPGEQLLLSLENGAWTRSPTQDVVVGLLLDDGTVINANVTYTGGFGARYRRSDFNFNNDIDPEDWAIFLANHNGDLSAYSLAEAYALGDLNGDRKNDFKDFRLFQLDYIDANGLAAFAALPGAIPEPASLLSLLIAALVCVFKRRR